jgi:hypothetical protein
MSSVRQRRLIGCQLVAGWPLIVSNRLGENEPITSLDVCMALAAMPSYILGWYGLATKGAGGGRPGLVNLAWIIRRAGVLALAMDGLASGPQTPNHGIWHGQTRAGHFRTPHNPGQVPRLCWWLVSVGWRSAGLGRAGGMNER